jgi:hypothetical protein
MECGVQEGKHLSVDGSFVEANAAKRDGSGTSHLVRMNSDPGIDYVASISPQNPSTIEVASVKGFCTSCPLSF